MSQPTDGQPAHNNLYGPVQPLSPPRPPPPYYPPVSPAGYYPPPPMVRPTSGLATASMVLGIIGLLVGWCMLGIPSIVAVFLGHAALRETRTGERGGHGMAVAGLILGYILAIPTAVVAIILIVGSAGS